MRYESYSLEYCESCGQIHGGSDELAERLSEPLHRVDVLEELGGVENNDVTETTGMEQGQCGDCGGQVVQRWYTVGELPEATHQPEDESEYAGRDPEEDSLFKHPDRGWQESSDVSGFNPGESDG